MRKTSCESGKEIKVVHHFHFFIFSVLIFSIFLSLSEQSNLDLVYAHLDEIPRELDQYLRSTFERERNFLALYRDPLKVKKARATVSGRSTKCSFCLKLRNGGNIIMMDTCDHVCCVICFPKFDMINKCALCLKQHSRFTYYGCIDFRSRLVHGILNDENDDYNNNNAWIGSNNVTDAINCHVDDVDVRTLREMRRIKRWDAKYQRKHNLKAFKDLVKKNKSSREERRRVFSPYM